LEDGDSILALIGANRLEEEDEIRTEIGSPNPGNSGGDNADHVTGSTTTGTTSTTNDLVTSLINKAKSIGMDTKFPFPSFEDMQNMTKEEYETLQDQLQALSYITFSNTVRHLKEQKEKKLRKTLSYTKEKHHDSECSPTMS
jgi:uncharacterized protein (DUF342 family)